MFLLFVHMRTDRCDILYESLIKCSTYCVLLNHYVCLRCRTLYWFQKTVDYSVKSSVYEVGMHHLLSLSRYAWFTRTRVWRHSHLLPAKDTKQSRDACMYDQQCVLTLFNWPRNGSLTTDIRNILLGISTSNQLHQLRVTNFLIG